jgi:hypothetical protein
MKKCKTCGDRYEKADIAPDGVCRFCAEKKAFAAFAGSCGLTRYPDPSGERYVYGLDGTCDGKKSECVAFMDELWNALVRARGGDEGLLLKKE